MKFTAILLCSRPSKAAIWLSRSHCIYENLAFEDWLFRNIDFTGLDGLLIWRNRPAVVIGKHQNSFVECDVEYAEKHNIDVARRNSGGGTVYHDLHNVNVSFFTSRKRHNRLTNLRFVQTVLNKRFNIDVEITSRHDLLLFGSKISGTAAKLAGKNSYHHLTLLIDYDASHMKNVLRSSFNALESTGDINVVSKATRSVRACQVGRLKQFNSDINFDNIVKVMLKEFANGYEETDEIVVDNFDENNYIGFNATLNELKSWNWLFGLNPPFSIVKNSLIIEDTATIDVEKGLITKFACSSPVSLNSWSQHFTLGSRFNPLLCFDLLDKVKNSFTKRKVV